jgi:4-hydroxy-4-methyl-2-oxoglutarate aldolase
MRGNRHSWLMRAVCAFAGVAASTAVLGADRALTPDEIIAAFRKPSSSTGNISDAVDEATGARGFMSPDMKPIFKAKIVGRAATALLRPVLKYDSRKYPNHALQILDEAEPGSVLVYVLEGGLDIAGMGNLMATTAKVRGLEAAVIDGAARDVEEVTRIGFPIFSRAVSPATSVGRFVSVAKQVPVVCAGVVVKPGDYIIGDSDGVVVVPQEVAARVVELIAQYDDKESRMIPIIEREKSMLKALEIYNRY